MKNNDFNYYYEGCLFHFLFIFTFTFISMMYVLCKKIIDGVDKPTSIRFQGTFDDVYDGDSLKRIPWHVIAGNHDNHGNVSAQIEYSKFNRRWNFPSLYHSSQLTSDDKTVTVDLILIDTPGLSGTSPITDKAHPNYYDKQPLRSKDEALDQWTWIEEKLSSSTANYIIVGGHFSVYSVCDHGSDMTLLTYLKPLLEKYNANYMSGHDHCMEHLNVPGSTVNYIVSGMGDDCCYKPSHTKDVPENSEKWSYSGKDLVKDIKDDSKREVVSGFTSFTATSTSLTFTFYDQAGRTLYTTPPIAPRQVN